MPLFEYAPAPEGGSACCHFETLQTSSEAPLSRCPTCGHPIARQFSPFGIGQAPSAPARSEPAKAPSTPAGRVAELTAGHVCRAGCRHS